MVTTHPQLYGYSVCECIVASAPLVERRMREAGLIKQNLNGIIVQGCYSTAVKDSARTHAWGGVLDLDDWTQYRADVDNLLTALGWCFVYRPPGILRPGSPSHWHGLLNGCPHLHPEAQAQLVDFFKGRNGLKSHAKDSGPLPSVTWQQALAADHQPVPATPTQEADDMNPDIVAALFYSMTGAEPARSDVAWQIDNAIRLGLTPQQVRTGIAGTLAARKHAVAVGFANYLKRTASDKELADWLAGGLDWDSILSAIYASPEAAARRAGK